MGAPSVSKHVINYLGAHEGEVVLLNKMAADLNMDEASIRGAIARAIRSGLPIVVVTRALAWKYTSGAQTVAPEPVPAPVVVKEDRPVVTYRKTRRAKSEATEPLMIIGKNMANETIVRDGSGHLFTLKPM